MGKTLPYQVISEHRLVITDPEQYDEFIRKDDEFAKGIHAIYGVKKGSSENELTSIIFNKTNWTPQQAKGWIRDNKQPFIALEPAKVNLPANEEERKLMEEERKTV